VDIRAILVAGRLLESEMEFVNILSPDEGTMNVYSSKLGPDDEVKAEMKIWWEPLIEARSWGIKDFSIYIKKLTLEGRFVDAEGRDTGVTFDYAYPESRAVPQIGPDADAPTPDNVYRLAAPRWSLDWTFHPSKPLTVYARNAEVDLDKHTIVIEF
jgi:hypothetical protein